MRNVVSSRNKDVLVDEAKEYKIYVSKGTVGTIYKLTELGSCYAFCDLGSVDRNSTGASKSFRDAIRKQLQFGVTELDSLGELATWINENI